MVRGPKKHLKLLRAPKTWALAKMSGVFAPKPSSGPHKARECLPLIIVLRNRLKLALTGKEVNTILYQRHILVDGRARTDAGFPAGLMDVISIPKTHQHFRLLYDVKGRFLVHPIVEAESKFKLCRVNDKKLARKGVPYLVTHDGRTIRYPNPDIKKTDTVKVDLATGKVVEWVSMDTGNLCLVTGGHNLGRVGIVVSKEHHKASFDIIHIKDASGKTFATRLKNVMVIGTGSNSLISLPKRKGVMKTRIEEREVREQKSAKVSK